MVPASSLPLSGPPQIDAASETPFKKLMAANRGEIAIRITRAGIELGLKTVGGRGARGGWGFGVGQLGWAARCARQGLGRGDGCGRRKRARGPRGGGCIRSAESQGRRCARGPHWSCWRRLCATCMPTALGACMLPFNMHSRMCAPPPCPDCRRSCPLPPRPASRAAPAAGHLQRRRPAAAAPLQVG